MANIKHKELFGISFSEECVYEIKNKPNSSSNPAEKRAGISKAPNGDVSELRSIGFMESASGMKNPDGSSVGVFLTGFEESSPVWQHFNIVDAGEKKAIVNYIKNWIKKPNEVKTNQNLDSSNTEYWRNYRYRLYDGLVLNMSDAEHRMTLYFALLNGKVATEQNIGNPLMHECPYKLVEHRINYDEAEEFLLRKEEARATISQLMKEDMSFVSDILKYVGKYNAGIQQDTDMFKRTIVKIFEGLDASINAERFVELILDKATTKEGKNEIRMVGMARDMDAVGIISRKDGIFMYKNVELGPSINDVVYKISGKDSTFDSHLIEDMISNLQTELTSRQKRK